MARNSPPEMEPLHLQLLNELERLERRLLAWGIVEIFFTEEEVVRLAEKLFPAADAEVLVRTLVDQRLLFERRQRDQDGLFFRSRSAETVRLLSYLKQWMRGKDWRTAPNLVADFRFDASPRQFPRRDLSIDDLLTAVSAQVPVATEVAERIRALAGEYRLSRFQIDSTGSIIRGCGSTKDSGVVVSAGTGSGKTLCFYLPILALFGAPRNDLNATRVIALYPRNELLKDQFSSALGWVHRLNRLRHRNGRRLMRIGAFFGPTPRNAQDPYQLGAQKSWLPRPGGGHVCPYARCPDCKSDMYWPASAAGVERLRCSDSRGVGCRFELGPDEILLTRDRMQQNQPDLLFTTTETLNRQLSDERYQQIFGVNSTTPPRAVLIDELHTYEGIHGAHVAGLLRRWRHAIGLSHPIQFTGLSATLLEASEFLATLTGIDRGAIEVIEPQSEHCDPTGTQYKLALRGDPVSATSLLSTTIQATMLLGRMLDPRTGARSEGAFGSKLFVFTDDLDVTHRLSPNLRDAEGEPPRPGVPAQLPLASLRVSTQPDPRDRARAGQNWLSCEDIGHNLNSPLRIGVTTSRNRGVDENAQVVVATASLEVGYDDDAVGAVIQHKAPRGTASFIQRMGRAGRTTVMRPWSVVVLSDYGRDRLAYQRFETLFDPQLPSRTLPIHNRYVLRIQAAYAFMDWLAINAKGHTSLWQDLAGPTPYQPNRVRQLDCAHLIHEVLQSAGAMRASLCDHLRDALGLNESQVRSVMWEEPRSLMYSVLPTTHRQLVTEWKNERSTRNHPLIGFIPAALFGDLNLPEVEIEWPSPAWRNQEPEGDAMPLLQAMRAFAPGKVSRRFSAKPDDPSLWIPLPDLAGGRQAIDISKVCLDLNRTELEPASLREGTRTTQIRLFRPWRLVLEVVPENVLPQSNSRLDWRSEFIATNEPSAWLPPKGTGWNNIIEGISFQLHADGTQAQIRRFTVGATAETRLRNNPALEIKTQLDFCVGDGEPAALGFDFMADAVVFKVRIPANLTQIWLDRNDYAKRSIRTAFFRSLVLDDPSLRVIANSFALERLQEIYLSAVSAWAARKVARGEDCSISQAVSEVHEEGIEKVIDLAFESIFRTVDPALVADDDDDSPAIDDPRLVSRLRELISDTSVMARMRQHASALGTELSNEQLLSFGSWLRKRYETTLGQALLTAARVLCPQTDAGDLLLDINPRVETSESARATDTTELWLSEESPGGTGVMEQFVREYSLDPRRFFGLLDAACAPAEFEVVDEQLVRAVRQSCEDVSLAPLLNATRSAIGNDAAIKSAQALVDAFSLRGVRVTASVRAAMFARLVRPGTSSATDQLFRILVAERDRIETDLGIEIDARVFAYVASELSEVRRMLDEVIGGANHPLYWYFEQVYSLLWPRGSQLRAQALSSYNPFVVFAEADRLLLDRTADPNTEVRLDQTLDEEWYRRVSEAISNHGVVKITTDQANLSLLRTAILRLAATPLDVGFLTLFPLPSRVTIEQGCASVTLRIREVS